VLLLQSEPALAPDRAIVLVVNATLNLGLSHGAISITGMGSSFAGHACGCAHGDADVKVVLQSTSGCEEIAAFTPKFVVPFG